MTDISRITSEVIEELYELDIVPPVVDINNIIQQACERTANKIIAQVEQIIDEVKFIEFNEENTKKFDNIVPREFSEGYYQGINSYFRVIKQKLAGLKT